MAVTLVYNCPHCATERAGFTLVGDASVPGQRYWFQAFFQCNTCFGPVVAVAYNGNNGAAPSQEIGDMGRHQAFSQLTIFPRPEIANAPAHTPESAARAFVQAEDAIKRHHWEAAGAMDRRALEIATKEMAPDHAALTLYKRIEKLAEIGKLTKSLKEWAHGLRLVGNDAVHEIEGLEETEAIQAHELTRFILVYLYTLPAQVEQARAERESGD